MRKSSIAADLLFFLMEQMDGYNALICSQRVLCEALGVSLPTITRAIALLKDLNFVKTAKTGTTNIYYVNAEITWKSWSNNKRYAEFSNTKVLLAESEQEKLKNSDYKKIRTPTLTYSPTAES